VIPLTAVYEHNPGDHDDPKPGLTWLLGLLGALLLVVVVLGVTALYFNVKAEVFQRQVVSPPSREVLDLRARQEALLDGGWVEVQRQGEAVRIYTIPIEQAMEIVVENGQAGGSGE
jgi:hypothetical protein